MIGEIQRTRDARTHKEQHMTTYRRCGLIGVILAITLSGPAWADTFGVSENQFTIDFVQQPGTTTARGPFFPPVTSDFRIAKFEITNDQWSKFKAGLGVPVTGSPLSTYASESFYNGSNVPVGNVSWYEAAQFVNWLNTSTGHHAAYNFVGTQGTADYALALWSESEADGSPLYLGTNLYRHKDAFYYLPSIAEWEQAAFWNGSTYQKYATKPGDTVYQGNGTNGGWNYYDSGSATNLSRPWSVGSGSEELNGTYDMMGNMDEWLETSMATEQIHPDAARYVSGTSFNRDVESGLTGHWGRSDLGELYYIGFRVASDVPEPASVVLLAFGGMAALRRRPRRTASE